MLAQAEELSAKNDLALSLACQSGEDACAQGLGALEQYIANTDVPGFLIADQKTDKRLEQEGYFGQTSLWDDAKILWYANTPESGAEAGQQAIGSTLGTVHTFLPFLGGNEGLRDPNQPILPFDDTAGLSDGERTGCGYGQQIGGLVWALAGDTSLGPNVAAETKIASLSGKGARIGAVASLPGEEGMNAVASAVTDVEAAGASQVSGSAKDQFFAHSAEAATHNAGSNEVVLGRHIKDSPKSYDEVAKARGSTYFSMNNWGAVSAEVGDAQMWRINQSFLDQQIAQGKTFLFTSDPSKVPIGTFTNLESSYLTSRGYTVVPDEGGMYRAVK